MAAPGDNLEQRSAGRNAAHVGARVAYFRKMGRKMGRSMVRKIRCTARALPAVFSVLLAGCAREYTPDTTEAGGAVTSARALGRDPSSRYPEGEYPLDGMRRKGDCPDMKLQKFSGETLRLSPAARITPSFREPLLELEQVVREVSLRVYDRVPSSILVAASYGCRTVNGSGRRLSEHALGNAIDIKGFRFADEDDSTPAKGKGSTSSTKKGTSKSTSAAQSSAAKTKAGTAAKKSGDSASFDVLVAKHWKARGDASTRRAARFLEELTQALLQRDVFRTLLGPAHRDHDDHFHFDMAPTHYVDL